MNDLLLRALSWSNTSTPPVWLMRQAGRYMPEFRALRQQYSFTDLCHNPELVAQVTSMPIDQLGVDAAILFSDILVVAEALQVGFHVEEGRGPVIDRPIRSANDIENLPHPNVDEALGYVAEGIRLLKPSLKVPLIGFCGAPFTIAAYMVEGGGSKEWKKTKQWMFRDPADFHHLLKRITDLTLQYLLMQIRAGADAIQIFESWAHLLAYPQFQEFSLHYLKILVEGLRPTGVPVILFCRGSSAFAEALSSLRPAAVSLDWNTDLPSLSRRLPKGIALQGNLDPDLLYAPLQTIQQETSNLLRQMRGHPGFIVNLGHGIKPDVQVDAVKSLVHTVQQYQAAHV